MMQGTAQRSSSFDDSQDAFLPCLTNNSFANFQMDVVRQLEAAAALITVHCSSIVLTPTQMASEMEVFIPYF